MEKLEEEKLNLFKVDLIDGPLSGRDAHAKPGEMRFKVYQDMQHVYNIAENKGTYIHTETSQWLPNADWEKIDTERKAELEKEKADEGVAEEV